jgi:hypothetical protein
MSKKNWLKPSEIAEQGLILNSKGKPDYRFIVRLINQGRLKAKTWAEADYSAHGQQPRKYYLVHIDEITKYNARGI